MEDQFCIDGFDFWKGVGGFFPPFSNVKIFCFSCVFLDLFLFILLIYVVQICFRLGRFCFFKLKVNRQLLLATFYPTKSLFCGLAQSVDCYKLLFQTLIVLGNIVYYCLKPLKLNLLHIFSMFLF